jgi:hypothetical protein
MYSPPDLLTINRARVPSIVPQSRRQASFSLPFLIVVYVLVQLVQLPIILRLKLVSPTDWAWFQLNSLHDPHWPSSTLADPVCLEFTSFQLVTVGRS